MLIKPILASQYSAVTGSPAAVHPLPGVDPAVEVACQGVLHAVPEALSAELAAPVEVEEGEGDEAEEEGDKDEVVIQERGCVGFESCGAGVRGGGGG